MAELKVVEEEREGLSEILLEGLFCGESLLLAMAVYFGEEFLP